VNWKKGGRGFIKVCYLFTSWFLPFVFADAVVERSLLSSQKVVVYFLLGIVFGLLLVFLLDLQDLAIEE
jgi:hypothetical protein